MAKTPAALARAAVLHLAGRAEEAQAEVEAAIAAGESSPALMRAKQQLSEQLGGAEPAAVSEIEAAFAQARYEDAALHCAKLTEIAPDRAEHWFNLGLAYEHAGRADEAATAYREAARRDPRARVTTAR